MNLQLTNTVLTSKRFIKQMVGLHPRVRVGVKCTKKYYGSSYGGWTITPALLDQHSVVYSFGIGEDISFDLTLIEEFGVTVHAFDPTPKSIAWVRSQKAISSNFKPYEWGLADFDGQIQFNPPAKSADVSYSILNHTISAAAPVAAQVYKLSTIMRNLGHTQVDLLKMDIEGAEYKVINDLMQSNIYPHQLLIEFHHHFKGVDTAQTQAAITTLMKNGYQIFDISLSGYEYAFVHLRA